MELTYEKGTSADILAAFGLAVDDSGYVVSNGERLVDGVGTSIKASHVGHVLHLPAYDLHVEGSVVVNKNGEDSLGEDIRHTLVAVDDETALVREGSEASIWLMNQE